MDTRETNEAELILQAQHGNEEALETLIQRHLALVYGLALRYLGHQADAEDASQETFVKAWKNLHKFNLEKNFQTWILTIAKNTCLDILRKKQVIPFSHFETPDGNTVTDSLVSPTQSPLEQVEQNSVTLLIKAISKKLSPAYQKVLELYYNQGLNFREIAAKIDEPLHTVKSRHRRAILQMKKFLN